MLDYYDVSLEVILYSADPNPESIVKNILFCSNQLKLHSGATALQHVEVRTLVPADRDF